MSYQKKKGVDGKACWDGYRYAGKEKKSDGTFKDKCIKVETIEEGSLCTSCAVSLLEDLKAGVYDTQTITEAEYQGRKVTLNKPIRTPKSEPKKFKVYVKDGDKVKLVRFGHQGGGANKDKKTMRIKKSNPKRRKSFRARHNCDNPGPKTKARYWSCKMW